MGYAYSSAAASPAYKAVAVTPHDSTNLERGCRGLYIGGAGNVVVVFPDDTAITFTAVPVGTFMPVQAKRVNFTSTTATAIVALY